MVGTEAERGGIVKHGSKMIQAVANAPVPQITIVIGGSFGAGNYGLCGPGYHPPFLFARPTSPPPRTGGQRAAPPMNTPPPPHFLPPHPTPPHTHSRHTR